MSAALRHRPAVADGSGWDDWRDEAPDDLPAEAEPTPGERLLYALGHLYRIWHAGRLPAPEEGERVG
jgi:hypothetical protein